MRQVIVAFIVGCSLRIVFLLLCVIHSDRPIHFNFLYDTRNPQIYNPTKPHTRIFPIKLKQKTACLRMTTQDNESMDFNKQLDRSRFRTMLERSKMDVKRHQQQGVEWCINREVSPSAYGPVRGGILADEMGLGKTVQMLGLMLSHFKRRTLILLPKSLIEQWVGAIERMLGHAPVVFHGPNIRRLAPGELDAAPIVISTYGMLRTESPLLNINWNRIIYDEAHHLRNSGTKKFNLSLKLNSEIMWFVTGTPIQNRQSDLHSLFRVMKIPEKNYMFINTKKRN